MPTLSPLARIECEATARGLTAYVDTIDECVYVFVPHAEIGDTCDDAPEYDDAIPVRTMRELDAALAY